MSSQGKVNILLVDDQPSNLLALEATLEELGENLVRATSSEEALRMALRTDFAAILLDVQMPGVSGFEAAKLIRSRERTRDTPIIFLTAFESTDFSVREAYQLGAVDYLVKPLVPEILRAKVAVFVELYRKTERLKEAERRRADTAVRASEERLKLLIDHAVEYAMLVLDPEGVILEWKAGAERIMGWTEAEAVGRSFAMIFPPEDVPGRDWRDELKRATRDGRADDRRWHAKKDGSRFFADGVLTALRDAEGNLIGFGKVLRDETARMRAEQAGKQSEARHRAIVETALDCIVGMDHEGRVTEFNPAAEETFGYSRAEVLGRSMDEFIIPPEYRDAHRRGLALYLATGEARVLGRRLEMTALRKGGGRFACELSISRNAGEPATFTGFLRDVTEQKRSVEFLREQDRKKEEFIAMLAHELRNPLGPIRNAVHLLQHRRDEATTELVRQMVERQVKHLSHIVEDLLEVSRLRRGKVELRRERLDIAQVVRGVASDHSGTFAKAGVELVLQCPEIPVWAMGDRTRLTQVFENLLTNAAKFTDRGGRVTVSVRVDGPHVVLVVRDTGVGIGPELLPHLFEPFTQAAQTIERSRGGLGLGLALVQGLVELHGGTVRAESGGHGKGAEFTAVLPRGEEPAALGQEPRPEPVAVRERLKVLVVEDFPDSAESLKMLLELVGCEVTTAATGPEGVEAAGRVSPDVVLCDIGLPGFDGYEVARRVRQGAKGRPILMAAITGYGQEEDRQRTREAGFDYHFVKPVNPAAIEKLLASVK